MTMDKISREARPEEEAKNREVAMNLMVVHNE